jgi:type III secretion system YscQ/HrcQ family protein
MNQTLRVITPMVRPAILRQVDDLRWRVSKLVGNGRSLVFAEEQMRLELFMPPWSASRQPGLQSPFDTAVECRHGTVLTDGSAALWCLLGGVPLSGFSASPQDQELRLSIALMRAPSLLTDILGPLALRSISATGRSSSAPDPAFTTESLLADDAIEMMLRVSRDDVTVYCRAAARPSLWLQLLGRMPASRPSPAGSAPAVLDDSFTLSVPVRIGHGSVPASALGRLQPGDVVRLETSFTTEGHGRLQVGGYEIRVYWRSRSPQHVFQVLATSLRRVATTSSTLNAEGLPDSGLESTTMNSNHHDVSEEEGAANEPLDEYDDSDVEQLDREAPGQSAIGERSNPDASALGVSLDRVPVTIVAEIGTLTITIGALRTLQPGMLLKLGARGQAEVVLRAIDGPPVAYAELVDIGGHLGLQVTSVVPS